jgi:DNA-binding CsgD family transcriptional regulator
VDGSADAARTGRLQALTARAYADLADLDPAADRAGIAQELLQRADRWGAFQPHPARVKAAAYAMTFRAELARLARSGEEAAWRAARDLWSEHGARAEDGYASARLAAALLAAGHRKDAEVELSAAYTVAGADAPLRRLVHELARVGRLTLTNVDTHGREDAALTEASGKRVPHGLTSRELDVLKLLATGATNAEIGRRLYMSPKTASVHVSAIIRKLGVNGRVQAATVAERMGLVADESDPGSV